jgi:ubiquitin C-terminal hydrolase
MSTTFTTNVLDCIARERIAVSSSYIITDYQTRCGRNIKQFLLSEFLCRGTCLELRNTLLTIIGDIKVGRTNMNLSSFRDKCGILHAKFPKGNQEDAQEFLHLLLTALGTPFYGVCIVFD